MGRNLREISRDGVIGIFLDIIFNGVGFVLLGLVVLAIGIFGLLGMFGLEVGGLVIVGVTVAIGLGLWLHFSE